MPRLDGLRGQGAVPHLLDKRNQIIADEVQQKGTVDHTPVYVREVVKRALELSATAIVLCTTTPQAVCGQPHFCVTAAHGYSEEPGVEILSHG